VFLGEGGMDMYLQVLDTFQTNAAVETKVLGLMNNIAEVERLRPYLMTSEFLEKLRYL